MPHWTIRSACPEDLESVLGLWELVGTTRGVSDTQNGLSSLLASDPHALLLAESGGALVGTLIAAWDGWRASFYRLAVHPDWRRLGIAIALVGHGERHQVERGAVRLTAIVADADPVATDFWRAAGYQRQSNRARFVRNLDHAEAPLAEASSLGDS